MGVVNLIQGMHTIPVGIGKELIDNIADLLPGWTIDGIFNYQAGAITQIAAAQLDIPLHLGSHKWINETIKELLVKDEFRLLGEAERTRRMAALVNFMYEASGPLDGAATNGFKAFTNLTDANWINKLGYRPTEEQAIALMKGEMTWSKILATPAAQDVLNLNPRIETIAGKRLLKYDGVLSNGGFFSRTAAAVEDKAWRALSSTQWGVEYAAGKKIFGNEAGVIVSGIAEKNFGKAEKLVQTVLEDGTSIASHARLPTKLLGRLAAGAGTLLLVVLSASAAEAAQLDKAAYSSVNKIEANRAFVEELFATATSTLAGLVAGALAGAATGGLLAIAAGAGAAFAGDIAGRKIGNFFYDNFPAAGNFLAEELAPILAPLGRDLSNLGSSAADIAGQIFNAVTGTFEYVGDLASGTDGLFGTNGPLFGEGGPLHDVRDIAKSFGFLKHDGTWSYGSFGDYLLGTNGDDIQILQDSFGRADGGKGDDVLIGLNGKAKAAGDPLFEDSTTPTTDHPRHLTLDGGDGNDWVLAFGGTSAADPQYAGLFNDGKSGTVTIGGAGRDWIYNTSEHGVIYGDTVDGLDPLTHQTIVSEVRASSPNDPNGAWNKFSDNIWWSGGTTVMDAGHNDVLKFFGMPLVGGDSSGGLALQALGGPVGGLLGVAIGSAQTFTPPEDTFYFDDLFSFITYKMDFTHGRHDMLVINEFEQLFSLTFSAFAGSVPDFNSGIMRIKNFDFVGSYTGLGQLALTNSTNYDDHGTFNMQFKKANPIWAVLAALPDSAIQVGLTGGGNAFGPLIDIALTGAAALANDNFVLNLKEVA